MNRWAGWLILAFGVLHTIGAFTLLGAAQHTPRWLGGELWTESLFEMNPTMGFYWLTVNSFGPSFVVIGSTVLWLDRRGITPPVFIAWFLAAWTVIDCALSGPGVGQSVIVLAAAVLLLLARRRVGVRDSVGA